MIPQLEIQHCRKKSFIEKIKKKQMKQLIYLQEIIRAFTENYNTVWYRSCQDIVSQDQWLVKLLEGCCSYIFGAIKCIDIFYISNNYMKQKSYESKQFTLLDKIRLPYSSPFSFFVHQKHINPPVLGLLALGMQTSFLDYFFLNIFHLKMGILNS